MLLLLVGMILVRKLVGFLPFRKMYNVFENSMMLYYTSLELKNALNFYLLVIYFLIRKELFSWLYKFHSY